MAPEGYALGMTNRVVIIGGGPAGNSCATYAARLGADVTMIERDLIGGAAHLLDCIPSKALIATGGAMSFINRAQGMGLGDTEARIDVENLKERVHSIETRLRTQMESLLDSQGVELVREILKYSQPAADPRMGPTGR